MNMKNQPQNLEQHSSESESSKIQELPASESARPSAQLDDLSLPASDKGNPLSPRANKRRRKDELEVTIAPGLEDTSDIGLVPPR